MLPMVKSRLCSLVSPKFKYSRSVKAPQRPLCASSAPIIMNCNLPRIWSALTLMEVPAESAGTLDEPPSRGR